MRKGRCLSLRSIDVQEYEAMVVKASRHRPVVLDIWDPV